VETARRLAGWYCADTAPYPIHLTGIRPGERLHEVLLSANEWTSPLPASGLQEVHSQRNPALLEEVPTIVGDLRALVEAGDEAQVRALAIHAADLLQ
jgi:FlaA1/EpsC-like NDP-sugar epimerase